MKFPIAVFLSDLTYGQPFRRQRSRKVKNVIFQQKRFLTIKSLRRKIEEWFCHHRVSLVKARRMIYRMTLKGQGQNLTSGQGHVMTRRGHVAYQSTCLDETNTTTPIPYLYLFLNKSYWQKTVGDPGWPHMTFVRVRVKKFHLKYRSMQCLIPCDSSHVS